MSEQKRSRFVAPIALALSLSIGSSAMAIPGETNSINNGANIAGGTYYNTSDSKTTFTNNNGTGDLHLSTGQTVRGIEVNGWGTPTGNGGTVHFYAPGGMVRLDGNVDVSGIVNGRGAYMGNGGRVFVDSAMLFQNGTIFANGINGGSVQFNVGAAMFGPNAIVQANGFGGTAGTISVNGSGVVDLQKGAIFDASGRSINTRDAAGNVNINIVGSVVNNEGIIRANGVAVDDGHIALLGGKSEIPEINYLTKSERPSFDQATGTDGGVIRIVATGQTRSDCVDCVTDKAVKEGTITAEEASTIQARQALLVKTHEGDVVNTGTIQANGADGQSNTIVEDSGDGILSSKRRIEGDGDWDGDYNTQTTTSGGNGGAIIVSAADDINNDGLIQANGGNGGDHYDNTEWPSLLSKKGGDYDKTISLAGNGGNGGIISLSAVDTVTNGTTTSRCKTSDATIEANGGHGGSHYGTESSYGYESRNGGNIQIDLGLKSNKTLAENAIKGKESAVITQAYADNSDYAGGQGGNGGAIGISYGTKLVNNGTIAAKGGNGGNGPDATAQANSYTNQTTKYTASYKETTRVYNAKTKRFDEVTVTKTVDKTYADNAKATATAIGGKGGDGGKGGLVVLSGPSNPTGSGVINVNGGSGGNGGNASATATAYADGKFAYSQAAANAYGGDAGKGGKAGYVVAPSTAVTFNYTAKDGNSGVAGTANAYAKAYSDAKAFAKGNDESTAKATAFTHTANVTTVLPTFDWSNNALIKTQANELLVNGNTAVLMSKNGKYGNYRDLSDRLDNATVRTVDKPWGESLPEKGLGPIRHFAVASIVTKPTLNLDKPSTRLINLDGLTSLTVTTTGDVTVPAGTLWTAGGVFNHYSLDLATGGGHISINAPNGTIINGGALVTGGLFTGGGITLAGKEVKNGLDTQCGPSPGYILTNGFLHGGSVILKGRTAVENLAVYNDEFSAASIISAGGLLVTPVIGGTIRLLSTEGHVFNEGAILANGFAQGGVVVAKAYTAAINYGTVQAKAYGVPVSTPSEDTFRALSVEDVDCELPELTGNGGFIRWHGNGLAVNGSVYNPYASMDVTGPSQGGVIQLTAGGPTRISSEWLPSLVDGIGITQGTVLPTDNASIVSSLAQLPIGSALNAGIMDARATNTEGTIGQIDIAGDGFAGAEGTATINGVTVGNDAASFFANPAIGSHVRLVAGSGAVKAVVCGDDIPETPKKPGTPDVPKVTLQTPFTFDIKGLPFQYYRPDLLNAPVNHKLVLRLGKSSSFMAKAYASVTQEILDLSIREYNRELSFGRTHDKAMASTLHYLKDSGIDAETANQLVEAIQAGSFSAETPVVDALKTLANETNGTVIRQ